MNLPTGLPGGTYCDVISGDLLNGSVSSTEQCKLRENLVLIFTTFSYAVQIIKLSFFRH